MDVRNVLFLIFVSGLLIGSACAAGTNDFKVDSSYAGAFTGDFSSLYMNGNQDAGIAIYKNVNEDVYDNEIGDAYDHIIHEDGQEYLTVDDDYSLEKNADNTANFTDMEHGEHGLVEVVELNGEQYIVLFWAKDTGNVTDSSLTSLLNDFNKDNNVTPVAF